MSASPTQMQEAIIAEMVDKKIGNHLQVIQNILIQYDLDAIALLSGISEDKKYTFVMRIKRAYVRLNIEVLKCKALLERNKIRIAAALEKKDASEQLTWEEHNVYVTIWIEWNEGLVKQAKSQFALVRAINILQAYEGIKKKGGMFGKTKDAIKEITKSLKAAEDKTKKEFELTDADKAIAKASGIEPSDIPEIEVPEEPKKK